MAKRKRTNNELLHTTQKTTDRETQTSLKTWDELRWKDLLKKANTMDIHVKYQRCIQF
jgi:hypothetical protein